MAARKLDYSRLATELHRLLAQNGPSDAQSLFGRLGISQPAFSRLVGRVSADLVIAGRTRGRRYAARRVIGDLPSSVPVYEVAAAAGSPSRHLLDLHPIEPRGFWAESRVDEQSDRFYEGLPYFLDDLRPAGFLGRLVPRQHPAFGFPPDIRNWTATHTIQYLANFGWNLPGNLIVGERAYEAFAQQALEPVDRVKVDERTNRYPELAQSVLSQGVPGSSAAGEQPKFLATRVDADRPVPVLIKFSPPPGDSVSLRISDLLVCEHLVHGVLTRHGQLSSTSSILRAGGRTFLEVERFDRVGSHCRRGTVSLHALDAEYVGELSSWTRATQQLARLSIISEAAHRSVCWLEHFGRLIANTDMHAGNVTFFTRGATVVTGLGPCYDMLPMLYAPRAGELVSQPFEPPLTGFGDPAWRSAWTAALDFWRSAASDEQISAGFRSIAEQCAEKLAKLEQLSDLVPRV